MVRDGRQIESLTVSCRSRAELHHTIDALLHGSEVDYRPVHPLIDEAEDHPAHCARRPRRRRAAHATDK
jgi:hypothetical protein